MQSLSDVIIFDLDDTLYKEADFVKSGFFAVAIHLGNISYAEELIKYWVEGKNAFQSLIDRHSLPVSIDKLLDIYRTHIPSIELDEPTASVLDDLVSKGKVLGVITDGRSITQRNKIKALGLHRWFEDENIIISEEFGSSKPNERNYRFFMSKYRDRTYTYIGDNLAKDFLTPNLLGWRTICIKDDGHNIHPQEFKLDQTFLPDITISHLTDIMVF